MPFGKPTSTAGGLRAQTYVENTPNRYEYMNVQNSVISFCQGWKKAKKQKTANQKSNTS